MIRKSGKFQGKTRLDDVVVEIQSKPGKPIKIRVELGKKINPLPAVNTILVVEGKEEYVFEKTDTSLRIIAYDEEGKIFEATRTYTNNVVWGVYAHLRQVTPHDREFSSYQQVLERSGIKR